MPIRASHKLVYEVYFSVFGKIGSGAEMPIPGQGGLQVMRRNLDTVVPQVSQVTFSICKVWLTFLQCVFVSEVLNLPSCLSFSHSMSRGADTAFRFDSISGEYPSNRSILPSSHRSESTLSDLPHSAIGKSLRLVSRRHRCPRTT